MTNLLFYFIFYSFIGWMIDTTANSIKYKKYTDGSYFKIGLCPSYGFAGLFIILPFWNYFPLFNKFLVFFVGLTIIEYLTALFCERTLHRKLWDYSNEKFNYRGRISFSKSCGWAVLALIVVYYIHPFISKFI